MLIGSIVLILVHFMVKWRIFKKWMRYCVAFLPVLFFLVNFYLIANLSDFKDIDVLTSGRLGIYAGVLGMMTKLNWLIGVQLPDGPMDGSLWMLFLQEELQDYYSFLSISILASLAALKNYTSTFPSF